MIPVFDPEITSLDIKYVINALEAKELSGTFGRHLLEFESEFASYCGCKYGVAVSSGTTALQLAVRVLNIGLGDNVLISSATNIATALAVVHNQALPIAIDSDKVTWNIDYSELIKHINSNTRAILPVHFLGHPVDMDEIMHIAKKYDLYVIEDCAEAHGAEVRGRRVGQFGNMGCFSFYANKIITTGEGGMIVTNDENLYEKLKYFRNLAFGVPRFVHNEAAYNFRMTGFQAALGLSQFKRINETIEKKRRIADKYSELLSGVIGINLPVEMEWAKNVYWMYGIVLNSNFPLTRDELMEYLKVNGVETRTFFCPMDKQPCLNINELFIDTNCTVANDLWLNGLYLPSSHNIEMHDILKICSLIKECLQKSPN
jgi:perosamine synthetase